jgi:hypothetical protein
VKLCARKIDPLDAEAVASGTEPILAADAAAHAAACPECGALVAEAGRILSELSALAVEVEPPAGFSSRILRLRPFSRRERLTVTLWAGPAAFAAGLFCGGLAMLGLPGVGAAALLPAAGVLRSFGRWLDELRHVAPAGLESLSEALRHEQALGLAAALLFVPLALGLKRVLARARR